MEFFNILGKNAAAAMIFSKTYRDRAAAAMTSSKTCRNRAAMDISVRSIVNAIFLIFTITRAFIPECRTERLE